jgi:hypothetical protein
MIQSVANQELRMKKTKKKKNKQKNSFCGECKKIKKIPYLYDPEVSFFFFLISTMLSSKRKYRTRTHEVTLSHICSLSFLPSFASPAPLSAGHSRSLFTESTFVVPVASGFALER